MNRSLMYIDQLENRKARFLMFEMHELLVQLIPQIDSVFKWRTPFFEYLGKHFCYLNIHKDHIYISFLNMKDFLFSEGLDIHHLKSVSKVYISDEKILRSSALTELILQAAVVHEGIFKK